MTIIRPGRFAGGLPEYVDPFYDDMRIVAGDLVAGAGADPETIAWRGSRLYCFNSGEILTFMTQVSHRYLEGSDLLLHLHWTPHTRGAAEEGNTVNWRIDMSVAAIDGTFPAETTYDLTDTCDGVDHEHQITTSATVDGTGLTVSCMLVGRVYRLAGDTWATNTSGNRPGLLEVDVHYQIDRPGSRTELVK